MSVVYVPYRWKGQLGIILHIYALFIAVKSRHLGQDIKQFDG